ncbi:methyltransferase family protein [Mesorhizobium loti]|uniref:Methyltransferase family protein n=1 Tax=Rhizobium loti TaxID=381 RepID=A0A8E2WAH4_RHILI|nr:class I SAM-dependent methyltransferase [Mesorhizobium loti]PWJ88409.1 methyltransferase family protein [Mesorhizobium loti]
MNALARQSTVTDLIEEYDQKRDAMEAEVKAFEAAYTRLEMAACIQGKFVGPVSQHRPHVSAESLKRNLCKSGWKAIYDRLQIDRIASARDRKLFDQTVENPPDLTFDNAKATFGDYLERPRHHILRGLAEVFSDLDPAYKSHSKVKIGVKGLPKRIILSNVSGYGSYGRNKLRDIVNALAAYRGEPMAEHVDFAEVDGLHSYTRETDGDATVRGLHVRKFRNGNGHVIFPPDTLVDINRALAEFYGEVLPDAEEENAPKRTGTSVSKDLQFYWTPKAVIDEALSEVGIYRPTEYSRREAPPYRVLEPSCGDGRILDELRDRGCLSLGIEVHAGRAAEARAKGHNVLTANFLECPAKPEFDFVVMNPPFYGRHYVKHVRHATDFLKPGGKLISVLPATAHYDHGELKGRWRDLPVGSFAEAGTNIPTGLMIFGRAA